MYLTPPARLRRSRAETRHRNAASPGKEAGKAVPAVAAGQPAENGFAISPRQGVVARLDVIRTRQPRPKRRRA